MTGMLDCFVIDLASLLDFSSFLSSFTQQSVGVYGFVLLLSEVEIRDDPAEFSPRINESVCRILSANIFYDSSIEPHHNRRISNQSVPNGKRPQKKRTRKTNKKT